MADAIDQILDIIRTMKTPQAAWKSVLDVCTQETPSPTWEKLPEPDLLGNIDEAAAWLAAEFSVNGTGRPGIYLGLDTLNMEERPRYAKPKNVEIGFSSQGKPEVLKDDYIFHCDIYGKTHLIKSLRDMKRVYKGTDISSPADYRLFLGYSGIVLLSAFESIAISNFIADWGFHDGDMFLLCHDVGGKYERLVR